MCGIAGIIGPINNNNILNIRKMISLLSHRGPDKIRILKTKSSLLAFSRLKIIDFDDRAMQPMISQDKKYVLLFNGEIYNYKKLKKNLVNKYNFITKSDTEVFLAMLILYGTDCLKHVNGMFSFCFINLEQNSYIMGRDRFGQKPLYYYKQNDSIYFASEIKSILSSNFNIKSNPKSISQYLQSGLVDHQKDTWFEKIYQVPAGELIIINNDKNIFREKWYDLENFKKNFTS